MGRRPVEPQPRRVSIRCRLNDDDRGRMQVVARADLHHPPNTATCDRPKHWPPKRPPMKLAGRTALVTGPSRSSSRAIDRAYRAEGARVVVTGRDAGALDALVAELGNAAHAVPGDLAAPETPDSLVAATLAHFGALDLLVNNAGAIHPARDLVDFAPQDWRAVLEVNLVAPAMLVRAAVPAMRKAGRGHVINVSSIGGRKGARGRSAYRASKAALINLTESLAAELAKDGIQVNCICPGVV